MARGLERGRVCLKARPGPWSSESRMGGCRATRSKVVEGFENFGYVEESELVEVCLGGSELQGCPPEFAKLQKLIF